MLPQDPMILLSVVNTRLRDDCPDLEALCAEEGADPEELCRRLQVYAEKAGITEGSIFVTKSG